MTDSVEVARAGVLEGLPHGFLGRRGGVSQGAVASLNVGIGAGDDPAAVAENRARAVSAVQPGARLVMVYQVHSADCVIVHNPWGDGERPHADAMVTDRPGVLLGILTADCAPVLLADRAGGVIGAAHAGWKGAFAGVLENTVAAMERLGARRERITAAIGPTIAQPSYEVDMAFYDRLVAHDAANVNLFEPGAPGHHHFDLPGYVRRRLRDGAGVSAIEDLALDTCANAERFFSYRRASLAGEPSYGRQIALIGLPQ